MTGGELTDGEVTSDEVTNVVFPIPTCIYGCPWLAQRLAGASSMAVMAAWRRRALALQSFLATASSDETCYIYTVT